MKGKRFSSRMTRQTALRVLPLLLLPPFLMGTYYGRSAVLVAVDSDSDPRVGVSLADCEEVPCQMEIRVDCEGRIERIGGQSSDGSSLSFDFRPEP